jgi:L-ascorbate metabolism protein UlaG (beta-lactamase superfamily)
LSLELWWLDQSGFRLRDPAQPSPVVFVDPFLTPSDRRTWQAPAGPDALAQADLVLATHGHTDHLDRPTLEEAAAEPGSRFALVVPRPLVDEVVQDTGLPRERVIGAQPGDTIDRPGLRVHVVPARHGVNVEDAYNFGEQLSGGLVRYLGYVVELGGARAYHAGDCIPFAGQAELLANLHPHLALLPINGRDVFRESERNIVGNMDPREAARLAADVGAQVLVPMHWELFEHNRGYPRDLVGYVSERYPELSVLVLGRGARVCYQPPPD